MSEGKDFRKVIGQLSEMGKLAQGFGNLLAFLHESFPLCLVFPDLCIYLENKINGIRKAHIFRDSFIPFGNAAYQILSHRFVGTVGVGLDIWLQIRHI